MESTSFSVPSITCNICSQKIQTGINTLDGIESVSVDLKSKTVNVEYNPESIDPKVIRQKVSSLGYEVVQ